VCVRLNNTTTHQHHLQAFTFIPALGAYVFIFAFTVRKFALVRKLWLEVFLMAAHYACFVAGLYHAGASLGQGLAFYATGYAFQVLVLPLWDTFRVRSSGWSPE
jgi:hypothetical protein